jgi:hypothetical protein
MLDDQHARPGPNDPRCLRQNDFDQAGILTDLAGKLACPLTRLDSCKIDTSPFRLGDDLLSDNEDVRVGEGITSGFQSIRSDASQIGAALNQRKIGNCQHDERARR